MFFIRIIFVDCSATTTLLCLHCLPFSFVFLHLLLFSLCSFVDFNDKFSRSMQEANMHAKMRLKGLKHGGGSLGGEGRNGTSFFPKLICEFSMP